MFWRRKRNQRIFQAPIFWSVGLGLFFTFAFYQILKVSPQQLSLLVRYATSHEVAYVSVAFFFTALCALVYKTLETFRQERLQSACETAVEDIKIARANEEFEDDATQISWFDAVWKAQTSLVYTSGFGVRVREIISIQTRRKSLEHLDQDIKSSEESHADDQHDSYAMIRIITWAMPMLGFLGTVIGISATLGQMDASKLASGSQEAMNNLTRGLYVAFDTTAVGLVLTMMVMFIQFAVNKAELRLLRRIDLAIEDLFGSCLQSTNKTPDLNNTDIVIEKLTKRLLGTVEKLIKKQSELWESTITQAQSTWQTAGLDMLGILRQSLEDSISSAHEAMQKPTLEFHTRLIETQSEGMSRFHETQQIALEKLREEVREFHTKLSEQIRATDAQQEAMRQFTQRILDLSQNAEVISAMEKPIQRVLHRMTDIDRFHDAAICLTEAVAVLGTQLERHGYIGRTVARRRQPEPVMESNVNEPSTESAFGATPQASTEPNIIPMQRKAG